MKERRQISVELGIQFADLMRIAADEDRIAAEEIGINIDKVGDRVVVTIAKEAAGGYIYLETGNSLGWILEEIVKHKCEEDLDMTICKMESGDFLVIQRFEEQLH